MPGSLFAVSLPQATQYPHRSQPASRFWYKVVQASSPRPQKEKVSVVIATLRPSVDACQGSRVQARAAGRGSADNGDEAKQNGDEVQRFNPAARQWMWRRIDPEGSSQAAHSRPEEDVERPVTRVCFTSALRITSARDHGGLFSFSIWPRRAAANSRPPCGRRSMGFRPRQSQSVPHKPSAPR